MLVAVSVIVHKIYVINLFKQNSKHDSGSFASDTVKGCFKSCPSLRVVESTTSYTFPVQTGGIFYFPWHRHRRERRLLVSPPKDTGKVG